MASRVGKYLLFETLGEGAFGKVKLGVHEESGEQVAVKIMDKSDIKAQEMTMNVRREIAIMKALKHRNIVNLRQVLTSQSKLYIVMDLVTGGELFTKILNEGKLEENIARRYFQQLVDGIEYCHRRGVCHRDLKPENLLIDESTGELKITDFGLSAMKGASTTEELLHTQCGSPNYCAPEIIARHKQGYNGTKVDAWSCGIILFALLAGFLPFYDENTKVLYRMIQRDDVKFPKKFPPDAKDLVLKLLHKEPDERYTLAEVKKHPWFIIGYEGDDSVPKSGSGASPPASRRRRRGHSRKSSVDQAPRSREMVPRRKSDKSDNDSGSHSGSTLPPVPPVTVHPAPPPVIDSGQPKAPSAHRPPAPPPVSSPAPRSPLPPLPPPPATTNPVGIPSIAPLSHAPAPPPPPPTLQAYGPSLEGRQVSPYAGGGLVRRKSRESRESRASGGGPLASGNPNEVPGVANSAVASGGLPTYLPLSAGGASSHLPSPPPFPAPEVHAETSQDSQLYSPHVGWAGSGKRSWARGEPNGLPPVPPAPFPPHQWATDPRAMYLGNTSSALSASKSYPEDLRVMNPDAVPSPSPSLPHEDPIMLSPEQRLNLRTSAMSPRKANVSTPKGARPKWAVSGPTPTSTYASAAMAPVTTPTELATGDSSWLRSSQPKNEERSQNTVKFDLRHETEGHTSRDETVSKGHVVQDKVASASKPMSIVEQRRLLYNQMATQADPPLPDPTLRKSARPEAVSGESTVGGHRYGDRAETPAMMGYPKTKPDYESEHLTLSKADQVVNGPSGSLTESQSPSGPKSDRLTVVRNEADHVPLAPPAVRPVVNLPDEEVGEETKVENVGNTQSVKPNNTLQSEEDDDSEIPLKQRLAAALARYRRIFRLGNNIGITASPSFSSNKGSGASEVSADDDAKRLSTHAEFFARAKTITGAWGIILTQELEEDSDSEDEDRQITEAELQAFSRLLDFWDNRRASASIPKGGEVVLDDEASSPLSDEDIISIQSLLQKLEPKQVEDEMTEVVDEGEGEGLMKADVPPIGTGAVDGVKAMDAESARVESLRDKAAPSTGSAPSEASFGAQGYVPMSAPITHQGYGASQQNGEVPRHAGASKPTVPIAPPPPPLPRPVAGAGMVRKVPPPPPVPARASGPRAPARHVTENVASWDRGTTATAPPPPPPPLPKLTPRPPQNGVSTSTAPPPPPPSYAAPIPTATVTERMVVTQSTVRDPFRPRAPPSYPPPHSKPNGSVPIVEEPENVDTKGSLDPANAGPRSARSSERSSREAEMDARKRKSSTNASDQDIEDRKTMSRDSARMHSGASAASDGSGGGSRRGHMRSPSRDEHATRGMFTFGMFKRKSSTITSFDSGLSPDQCLNEIGGILSAMGCEVMVKRGENKLKCKVPIKNSKLMVSITCTQEKRVSTVHFKKGKKDRSQVDAKEFYDFYRTVHDRFMTRVGKESRVQS